MKIFAFNVLHRLKGQFLLILFVSILGKSSLVLASSTIGVQPIIITNSVSDGLFQKIFKVVKNLAYSFNTFIQFPGGYPYNADLYFGVLPPAKDKVFTWVKSGEQINLQDNLLPIVKNIPLKEQSTFILSSALNHYIEYSFTGFEPAGMYIIFTLLVISGEDPSNTQNWINLDMDPIFFNP